MEKIIKQYKDNKRLYDTLAIKIELLIKDILAQKQIPIHTITSRVKSEISLCEKISKKNEKYSSINEITDLVGIRSITYFDDDVEEIAKIIQKEFIVDVENSINKKALIDIDRFGYLSYHLVAQINKERASLLEYKRYKDIKFEIQIRSILQHAWAEIEHDIGYKSKQSVPNIVKRRLSRVAGLLELADSEFCGIKKTLQKYREDLSKKEILNTAGIDSESISKYIQSNPTVKSIDQHLCGHSKYTLKPNIGNVERCIKELAYCKITTIGQLDKILKEKQSIVKKLGVAWLNKGEKSASFCDGVVSFCEGISLFYLAYSIIAESGNVVEIVRYLDELLIGNSAARKETAEKLLHFYKIIKT